jgi:hypothetical protein
MADSKVRSAHFNLLSGLPLPSYVTFSRKGNLITFAYRCNKCLTSGDAHNDGNGSWNNDSADIATAQIKAEVQAFTHCAIWHK